MSLRFRDYIRGRLRRNYVAERHTSKAELRNLAVAATAEFSGEIKTKRKKTARQNRCIR
jgi:hypothetical protein